MSGMKNIAGQKYGLLTAVRPTEERKHGYVVWEWRCDCGNAVFVSVQDIKRRKNPSCGCYAEERKRLNAEYREAERIRIGKIKQEAILAKRDITGQKFGMLTAIRPTEERKHHCVVWEFKCDCGSTVFRSVASINDSVRSGCVSSCDCCAEERKRLNAEYREAERIRIDKIRQEAILAKRDITGQKFGMLTAVRPTEEHKRGSVVWEWRCDCGNAVFMSVQEIKRRKNPSCDCCAEERKRLDAENREAERIRIDKIKQEAILAKRDITGQKYGMLTAVRPTEEHKCGSVVWEFKCDCGSTVFRSVSSVNNSVNRGWIPSCGCGVEERKRLNAENREAERIQEERKRVAKEQRRMDDEAIERILEERKALFARYLSMRK